MPCYDPADQPSPQGIPNLNPPVSSIAPRPRVLFVAHGHPGRRRGGAENCALLLYDAIRQAGAFDPWLVAAAETPAHANTPWSVDAGDPRQILLAAGEYDRFWGRLVDRRGGEDWRQLLQSIRPDVIHFHHVEAFGYDFIRHARNACPDAPIVYTLHDYQPICAVNEMLRVPTRERCSAASPARCHDCLPAHSTGRHFLRQRWIRAAVDLVDRFIAPSHFLKDKYVEWGLPAARIEVIENARGAATPHHQDRVMPLAERPPNRFAYFGQLSEVKGVLVLLRAARLLHHRGVDVEFAIHGANLDLQEARFREAFRRELAACPPSVVIHPPYPPSDVDRLMRAVDWVVVPSLWWENSPLVIQEAFLNQRPVICSDIGGMAEKVRPGTDGLWFTAGDAGSLAATIEDAARSRERWCRLSAATVPPPTPAAAAAIHETIYRELRSAGAPAQAGRGAAS